MPLQQIIRLGNIERWLIVHYYPRHGVLWDVQTNEIMKETTVRPTATKCTRFVQQGGTSELQYAGECENIFTGKKDSEYTLMLSNFQVKAS